MHVLDGVAILRQSSCDHFGAYDWLTVTWDYDFRLERKDLVERVDVVEHRARTSTAQRIEVRERTVIVVACQRDPVFGDPDRQMIGRLSRRGKNLERQTAEREFISIIEKNGRNNLRPVIAFQPAQIRSRSVELSRVAEGIKAFQPGLIIHEFNMIVLSNDLRIGLSPETHATRVVTVPMRQDNPSSRLEAFGFEQLDMTSRAYRRRCVNDDVARVCRHHGGVGEPICYKHTLSHLECLGLT